MSILGTLLLAVEDIDARVLSPATVASGVQLLKSTSGRDYFGPAPIKGHRPHRYVFQLFALAAPVSGSYERWLAGTRPWPGRHPGGAGEKLVAIQ